MKAYNVQILSLPPSLIFFPNRGNKLTIIFHGSMETKEKTSL